MTSAEFYRKAQNVRTNIVILPIMQSIVKHFAVYKINIERKQDVNENDGSGDHNAVATSTVTDSASAASTAAADDDDDDAPVSGAVLRMMVGVVTAVLIVVV